MKLKIKEDVEAQPPDPNARKIIFSHGRGLGDGLMFTAGIRDFKLLFPEIRVGVETNQMALFENSPYIDRTLKKGQEGVEFYHVGYPAVGTANNTNVHFTQMFLLDMVAMVDHHAPLPMSLGEFCAAFSNGHVGDPSLGDPEKCKEKRFPGWDAKEPFISLREKYKKFGEKFARQRGDVHLSAEEKADNLMLDLYGVEKYWVVAPGGKRDCTAKIWDWERFNDVLDHFDGRITFVVIGRSDLLVERYWKKNVVYLVDKFNTNIRGILSLVYHADGCISGPSFLHHLAATIPPKHGTARKPCVSIWGGREPSAWSWYCNHQMLHTNGAFSCCSAGGCWKARVVPLQKDKQHNKSLCKQAISQSGRTVQRCMDVITSQDVIHAIERYYEGDLYNLGPAREVKKIKLPAIKVVGDTKSINLVGNLNSRGGGEQSLITLSEILKTAGWTVHLHPWGAVNDKYQELSLAKGSFRNGMEEHMRPGIPLLFYANDCTREFTEKAQPIVEKSSALIIGINYINTPIPTCRWLATSDKLRGIIFQNTEKRDEFDRDAMGFENVKRIVLFGAVNLHPFLEVCPPERKKDQEMVILKHCMPDFRKYVTEESEGRGEKIHIWQQKVSKDRDIKFYSRLLKDTTKTRFEFMEAHKELENEFIGEKRMVFHKFDSMPVTEFLARGHVYLYRTSNLWRDQYPRVVAEALAAGLPVLTEPRDGTADRVIHGDTGFYAIDYDAFRYGVKILQRKEDLRHKMGMYAKDWARMNLDPRKWIDVLEDCLDVG